MIAALLLTAAAPAGAVPVPVADEIVVIAQKLSRVRVAYHVRRGQLVRCDIRRTSGSATLDGLVCQAARQCAAEQPDMGDRRLAPCIHDRVRILAVAARER